MKIRFRIDPIKAFRRGLDLSPIGVVDVTPSTLDQRTRDLIADRLDDDDALVVDIYLLKADRTKSQKVIEAEDATFEALLAAILLNEEDIKAAKRIQSTARR